MSRRTRKMRWMRIYNMSVMVKMSVPERKIDGVVRDGSGRFMDSRWLYLDGF